MILESHTVTQCQNLTLSSCHYLEHAVVATEWRFSISNAMGEELLTQHRHHCRSNDEEEQQLSVNQARLVNDVNGLVEEGVA